MPLGSDIKPKGIDGSNNQAARRGKSVKKNKGLWILIIAAGGVFIGVFLHEIITEYREQFALQELLEQQQTQTEQTAERQREQAAQVRQNIKAEKERKRKVELYRNTACAINNDTNHCACIHEKTGARITLSQNDCIKRAKQITW